MSIAWERSSIGWPSDFGTMQDSFTEGCRLRRSWGQTSARTHFFRWMLTMRPAATMDLDHRMATMGAEFVIESPELRARSLLNLFGFANVRSIAGITGLEKSPVI